MVIMYMFWPKEMFSSVHTSQWEMQWKIKKTQLSTQLNVARHRDRFLGKQTTLLVCSRYLKLVKDAAPTLGIVN